MLPFENIGRLLLVAGLLLVVIGLLIMVAGRLPWLGRLPGDILIQRGNTTFWFPLVTGLVLSILLSVLLTLIAYFTRR